MIPRDVKIADGRRSLSTSCSRSSRSSTTTTRRPRASRPYRGRELRDRDQRQPRPRRLGGRRRSAPISRWSTATVSSRRARLARSVRAIGFETPLWALADSHRISDMAVLGLTGEVDGYIYLGQQTPAFYAKQVVASLMKYGKTLLPPFFGGLMAYDGEANIAFDCPGHQGGQFYRKSPAGQLFFKHFGESIFRNDLCNADVDLGDLLIHEGPGRGGATPRRAGVRRRQDLFRPQRHEHLQQDRDQCLAEPRRPRSVRPQQSQIAASGRTGAGRRHPDLPADLAQCLRDDRRRRLGCLGRGVSARADPRQSSR